jgi:DNA polymerase-3 subunit beta
MKLMSSADDLLATARKVLNVAPAKSPQPICSNVLVEASEDGAWLTATDLDVTVRTRLPATVEEEGAVTVPAKRLGEIARQLGAGEVRLAAEQEKVTIEASRSRFQILGLPADDFPPRPSLKEEDRIRIPAGTMLRLITKTVFAASTDESRRILMGVLWEITGEKLRMVSTDGRRLAKIDVALDESVGFVGKLIVPPKALNQLAAVAGEEVGTETVIDENYIAFVTPDVTIYSKLIEGHYPNYEGAIPKTNALEVRAPTEGLFQALRRVSILSNMITREVRLTLDEGLLTLTASTPEVGEASEELEVTYSGTRFEIGYNAHLLMEALGKFDSPEVKATFGTPVTAGLWYPTEQPEDQDYMVLLMPLRLAE